MEILFVVCLFCVCQIHILFGILIPLEPPHPFHLWSISSSRRENERARNNQWWNRPLLSSQRRVYWLILSLMRIKDFWGVFSSSSSVLLLRVVTGSRSFWLLFLEWFFHDAGLERKWENYWCCCVACIRLGSFCAFYYTICKTRLPLQVLNWYTARGCNTITGTTNKHMLDFLYFLWFFVFLFSSGREEIRINISGVFLLRLTRGTRQFEVDALTDDKILENNSKTCLGSW